MWRLAVRLIVLSLIASCSDRPSNQLIPEKKPKNFILFIGDGFGVNTFSLPYLHRQILHPERQDQPFAIEQMADRGSQALLYPYPDLSELVIESAGAATTLATGVRVSNDRIGVTSDGESIRSIAEDAHEKGLAVGVVTTTSIVHATPAAFYAHAPSRSNYAEIAVALVESGLDVFLGGGLGWFVPEGTRLGDLSGLSPFVGRDQNGYRTDGRNLLDELKDRGYTFVSTQRELEQAAGSETGASPESSPDHLVGLFAENHPPFVIDRNFAEETGVASLDSMVRSALSILRQDPDGFFLIVEGGKIDFAGHDNDVAALLGEFLEFDAALHSALQFAEEQGETLILLTADHETGGMGFTYYDYPPEGEPHSFAAPLEEYGYRKYFPNQNHLKRVLEQKVSLKTIAEELGEKPAPEDVRSAVLKYTGVRLSDKEVEVVTSNRPATPSFATSIPRGWQARIQLALVLSDKYGVSWSTKNHTSFPVMLLGFGPGSDACHGIVENTAVYRIMKDALN